jgi:Fic-DOC domain mobile mystery protein B
MEAWKPIPGETPIDDISGLKPRWVKTRAQLNAVEARNIHRAVKRYLIAKPTHRQAPFTLDWCYKLHRHMFGDVWRWAGTKRTTELNLGVPAYQIDVALDELMNDLAYWRAAGEMNIIEQVTRLHHRAVSIHPFLNGNGRWARLLANIFLKQSNEKLTIWPEETIGNTSVIREEYLQAIRAADNGDHALLMAIHRRFQATSDDTP